MSRPGSPDRILHLHSTFNAGGKEVRSARLMNAFGKRFSHVIVSSEPHAFDASKFISRAVSVSYQSDFPSLRGFPTLGRLSRIAKAMRGFDLVLTYNWGAMDAVMAHTLFCQPYKLPPLVHHEDGFNADEAVKLKASRNWFRRIALGRTAALVVPSERLERIALDIWYQPRSRVQRIANGLPVGDYAQKPRADVLPGLIKRSGELWLGSIAGLRAVKNLPRLVRAFSGLPDPWQLVIVGKGPEEQAIRAEAERLGIGHRVHLPGFVEDPAKIVGLFDVFALSSESEQFPLSVVEAMSAALPVASPDVGDVAAMVADENAPFIVPAGDEPALADAIERLAANPALRRKIGAANRARAAATFDEKAMIAAYRNLYESAISHGRWG
ncbi:MAG: glycosyltransferase family 4 protein [Novosphingobium sp.]